MPPTDSLKKNPSSSSSLLSENENENENDTFDHRKPASKKKKRSAD